MRKSWRKNRKYSDMKKRKKENCKKWEESRWKGGKKEIGNEERKERKKIKK